MADAMTIAGAIGVGVAAFATTCMAAWPIVKKVREVVPPATPAPMQLQSGGGMQQSSPQLPAYQCSGCAHLADRVDGIEERERQRDAMLWKLIGKLGGK